MEPREELFETLRQSHQEMERSIQAMERRVEQSQGGVRLYRRQALDHVRERQSQIQGKMCALMAHSRRSVAKLSLQVGRLLDEIRSTAQFASEAFC